MKIVLECRTTQILTSLNVVHAMDLAQNQNAVGLSQKFYIQEKARFLECLIVHYKQFFPSLLASMQSYPVIYAIFWF